VGAPADKRWSPQIDDHVFNTLVGDVIKGTFGLILDSVADDVLTDVRSIGVLLQGVDMGQWWIATTLPKATGNIVPKNSNDSTMSFRSLCGLKPRHKEKGAMTGDEQSTRHTHKLPCHLWGRTQVDQWKLYRVIAFFSYGATQQHVYMLAHKLSKHVRDDFAPNECVYVPPWHRFKMKGEICLIDVSTFEECKQAWAVGVSWRLVSSEDETERNELQELQLWVAEQVITEPNL
jgi:hypothetical protein